MADPGPGVKAFVHPGDLAFVLNDKNTHKQLLTIYNPYDKPMSFGVFCTAFKLYSVKPTSGQIRPSSSLDVVVRLNLAEASQVGTEAKEDKFLIEIRDDRQGERGRVLGKKMVLVQLSRCMASDERGGASTTRRGRPNSFKPRRSRSGGIGDGDGLTNDSLSSHPTGKLLHVLGLLCVGVVLGPMVDGVGDHFLATLLPDAVLEVCSFTVAQKIVAAYIFGIISAVALTGPGGVV